MFPEQQSSSALIPNTFAARRRSRAEPLSSTRARMRCRFLSSSSPDPVEVLLRAETHFFSLVTSAFFPASRSFYRSPKSSLPARALVHLYCASRRPPRPRRLQYLRCIANPSTCISPSFSLISSVGACACVFSRVSSVDRAVSHTSLARQIPHPPCTFGPASPPFPHPNL